MSSSFFNRYKTIKIKLIILNKKIKENNCSCKSMASTNQETRLCERLIKLHNTNNYYNFFLIIICKIDFNFYWDFLQLADINGYRFIITIVCYVNKKINLFKENNILIIFWDENKSRKRALINPLCNFILICIYRYFWWTEFIEIRCNMLLVYLTETNRVYSYHFVWRDIKEIHAASIAFSLSIRVHWRYKKPSTHIDFMLKKRRPAMSARPINTFKITDFYCADSVCFDKSACLDLRLL